MNLLATTPPTDTSRDPRIEDPTNRWIIHPLARALLPTVLRMHIPANLVSFAGLLIGGAAAAAYLNWADWRYASLGFVLSIAWLVADGLDGMVARSTGTASAFGRIMDGMCDYGVFLLFYLVLASSIGTTGGWILSIAAGVAHAVQSNLYEAERYRFHRRQRGEPALPCSRPSGNPLVRGYDAVGTMLDPLAAAFDRVLARNGEPAVLGAVYASRAVPALAMLRWLSANVRVIAIYAACLLGDPRLFWWFEIVPLSGIAAYGIIRHRRIEAQLVAEATEAELATDGARHRLTGRTKGT